MEKEIIVIPIKAEKFRLPRKFKKKYKNFLLKRISPDKSYKDYISYLLSDRNIYIKYKHEGK